VKRARVTIAGLGLIGGSLARALSGQGYSVVGVDTQRVRRKARESGAVARTSASLERGIQEADVLVLAAPPQANVAMLRRIARADVPGLVITDVSSVKVPICREAERLGMREFVGGHPMAGRAEVGWRGSQAELFQGCTWAMVGGAARARHRVARVIRDVGARPFSVNAEDHDRAVAFLSHVPQLVAWALLEAAQSDEVAARNLALAGPGFRDMTRLAASPRGLWREILSANTPEVKRALAALRRALGARPRVAVASARKAG
jgi:prephenate dehydrogenase